MCVAFQPLLTLIYAAILAAPRIPRDWPDSLADPCTHRRPLTIDH